MNKRKVRFICNNIIVIGDIVLIAWLAFFDGNRIVNQNPGAIIPFKMLAFGLTGSTVALITGSIIRRRRARNSGLQ